LGKLGATTLKQSFTFLASLLVLCAFGSITAHGEPASEFDEAAIRTSEEGSQPTQAFSTAVSAFEAANDATVKANKYEDVITVAAEGMLAQTWPVPSGGWNLIDFPSTGTITIKYVRDQQFTRAWYTKLVAQNEADAMKLRGAGTLLLTASLDGEQWGERFLLGLAQQTDGNLKRLAYWFTKDFGQDVNAITWSVDWSGWQQAYTAASALGKAIILRNVTALAVKKGEFATAEAINMSALSGSDRELKAIALAFGHSSLGSSVTAKWSQLADDASEPQIKALAAQVKASFNATE
jgi:hypothetical protein